MDVPVYHSDEKKLPNQEILKSVTGGVHRSRPAMGRELEDIWIAAMMDSVEKKDRKFRSSGFGKHDRNWLLAYDNWSPHPSNLNDQELECLARRLHGSSCQNAFDKVFILQNSNKRYSHGSIGVFALFSGIF